MQRLIRFEESGSPSLADWLGVYAGQMGGVEYTFELFDHQGASGGRFSSQEETLDVYGLTSSNSGALYGLLLDPAERSTIAIFRARLEGGGLLLELDVPDPDERLDFSGAERIRLARLPTPSSPEEVGA